MDDWQRAAALDDIDADTPCALVLQGVPIALYRFGDVVHAVGDRCPHQADVKLSDGYLDGDVIECPMHQSCFNVKTGRVLSLPAREDIPVYETRIEAGQVLVKVPPT